MFLRCFIRCGMKTALYGSMKAMTSEHARAMQKLAAMGITTIAEVDRRKGNESRFGFLRDLVGFDGAMWVINDLAINTCCKKT